MSAVTSFNINELEVIAKLCADELTGSEIGKYLKEANLNDFFPKDTKWKRMYASFSDSQKSYGVANHIVRFISMVFSPYRYTERLNEFREVTDKLNKILLMRGWEFRDDGKIHTVPVATSLSEAAARAQRLKSELKLRRVHPEIMKFAESEIQSDNYFHTVLEAMKSVTAVIREKTSFYADGYQLVDAVFCGKPPRFIINNYITDSEKGEQQGFANLLKGLYGTFRNPLAHEAKIAWNLSEGDALDILSMISYVHRKLQKVKRSD